MSLAIDVCLLAVLLVAVIASAKKGLVRTVLELVAFAAALLLAVQLCAPMAKACYENVLSERVETKIAEELRVSESASAIKKASVVLDSLPGFVKGYVQGSDTSVAKLAEQIANGNYSDRDAAKLLNENIAQPVCETVLSAVLFLLLFAVLGGVFQWLVSVLSKLFKIPIVKNVNALLGGVFGAVKGCAFVFVAVFLLTAVAPYIEDTAYREALQSSHIVSFVSGWLPDFHTKLF